ncbi:MAG: alpha/beta fold hydrolase, partial [Pseudomonadota bacterium]
RADTSEADIVVALSEAIEAEPGSVALVGHSGGGMLVTPGATADPHRVSHGIWIAGMLTPDGRSFDDIAGPGRRFGVPRSTSHDRRGCWHWTEPEDLSAGLGIVGRHNTSLTAASVWPHG